MEHVMSFAPDGTVKCLWTEELPLHELGRLEMERASHVEFNAATQQWEVCFAGDKFPSFGSPSRKECIAWEIRTLNSQL